MVVTVPARNIPDPTRTSLSSLADIYPSISIPTPTFLQQEEIKINMDSLTPAAITTAYALIKPHIHRTPLLTNTTLSNLASSPQDLSSTPETSSSGDRPANPKIRLFFKCENLQRIGAFKARGAFHALKRLIDEMSLEEVQRRGVVTHSSGTSSPHTPLFPIYIYISNVTMRWM